MNPASIAAEEALVSSKVHMLSKNAVCVKLINLREHYFYQSVKV